MLIADGLEKPPYQRPRGKSAFFEKGRLRDKERLKQRRKFVLKAAALALLAAAGVAGAAALYRAVPAGNYFTVKNIRVSGTRALDADHVARMVAPLLMGNIFTRDLERAAGMLEKIPLVDSASVRIKLPDIAEVAVAERVPAAVAYIGGRPFTIDAKGVVIGPDAGAYGGMVIRGLAAAQRPGERITDPALADVFRLAGVFGLDTLFHDMPAEVDIGKERITVKTAGGLLMKFGPDKDEWEERFMQYLTVRGIEADFGPGFAGYDLSFKNQLVAVMGAGDRRGKTANNHRG